MTEESKERNNNTQLLNSPRRWHGIRSRQRGRFKAEVSHEYRHEDLGMYPTVELAAAVRDARVIEVFGRDNSEYTLNYPELSTERINQLSAQAKSQELRVNERLKLGIEKQQTLGDIIEIFAEEDNSNPIPLLERRLVDIIVPADALNHPYYSGKDKEYCYFKWSEVKENSEKANNYIIYYLDKYERDSDGDGRYLNNYLRTWDSPKEYTDENECIVELMNMIGDDNRQVDK